jgi:3,4-dehydroadipyl-CoA semialdehyde dehydrogenase
MKLMNYVGGQWIDGGGDGTPLVDPVTGAELARASSVGLDLAGGLEHARRVGGPALRALSYGERAGLLGRIADVLTANRSAHFEIALANSGSPEADASFDIDGAVFTLKYFARTGAALGAAHALKDGETVRLARDEAFQAAHIALPLGGAAILINAFNFPAWGLWEKAAPALLSGVPVFVKPATATCWLAQRMVDDVVKAGVLPVGALSVLCGGAGDLLHHVGADDVVAFTGSAETALQIRSQPALLRRGVRVNVEADSLNAAILGPDASPDAPVFDLLVREVVREMTGKAGQKCTAIRRVIVPAGLRAAVAEAIRARLAAIVVGNPRHKDVTMGPLVTKAHQRTVLAGLDRLRSETTVVFDGGPGFAPVDADPARAAFVPPTLLACDDGFAAQAVHDVEVFGPAATVLGYTGSAEAWALAALGGGSLVASVYSADPQFLAATARTLAPTHGRILAVNPAVGGSQTGHGNVMPMCVHGGPGRAGNGEELGGLRALNFYHRRTAVQAHVDVLSALAEDTVPLRY